MTEEKQSVRVLLVGRPNAGKSSLYNRLTGGDAKVGNFPGITVDILEATVKLPNGVTANIVDLPGFYGLDDEVDAESDEGVARTFLNETVQSKIPSVLVQVLDGTQLALSLRLTHALQRLPLPFVAAVTQCDLLEKEGIKLDEARLSSLLEAPVLGVSARRENTKERVLTAIVDALTPESREAAKQRKAPAWNPEQVAKEALPRGPERTRSAQIDRWALHPVLGPVLFLSLMASLFAAVFLVADPATSVLDALTQRLGNFITRKLGEGLLASFLSDGLLGGAGTVLAFLPQIVVLTVAMELLDASGYLARGAFLVDRLLRVVGLGGRAFVPLLTAHACAVPAIQATRVLRDPRERLTAMLVLPLMTCSARIPTYGLLLTTFFAHRGAWFRSALFVGLYFAGIASGLVAAFLTRRTVVRGRALPLVLEMPAYRVPEAKAIARAGWNAATRFLRDVGTTILVASALLWALLSIPLPGTPPSEPTAVQASAEQNQSAKVQRLRVSVGAGLGRALEPITKPLGFDWRINVGLLGSFGARELMVGTLGVIFGLEDTDPDDPGPLPERVREARNADGSRAYSAATGLSLMVFFILACQCLSTVAAIYRETRSWRWPLFVVGYTYFAAYLASLAVFHAARMLGL